MTQKDSPRLAELRVEIAERLRKVCVAMPDEEFAALVARMAEVEYKDEARASSDSVRARWGLPPLGDGRDERGRT